MRSDEYMFAKVGLVIAAILIVIGHFSMPTLMWIAHAIHNVGAFLMRQMSTNPDQFWKVTLLAGAIIVIAVFVVKHTSNSVQNLVIGGGSWCFNRLSIVLGFIFIGLPVRAWELIDEHFAWRSAHRNRPPW